MNVEPYWHRICGLQIQEDGQLAAVWLGLDKGRDRVTVYDCYRDPHQPLAMQAAAIRRRGKWIPVAWAAGCEEIADLLRYEYELGLIDPVKDSDAMANTLSRAIDDRMAIGQFWVDRDLKSWIDERKEFHRREDKVPRGYPLMTATRIAYARLDWARRDPARDRGQRVAPKLSTV